jgi:hypothetical protein
VEAAESIAGKADALKEQVYQRLLRLTKMGQGSTDHEGELDMGLGGSTYRPRRIKLVEEKLVYDSCAKRKARRAMAVVWMARPRNMEKTR